MKPKHLDTVISLQRSLDRATSARKRLGGIPEWMRELHEEHTERQAEITALEESIEQARRERREAEGAIEEQQTKLKRYQEQINAVQTQREYGALLQEIDTAKAEIRSHEESALAAMERRDQAEAEVAEKRAAFQELDERHRGELARWEEEKPSVEEELRRLEEEIGALEAELPQPVLAQFRRVHDRLGGTALAAIRTVSRGGRGADFWHCAACNYRVRPQVVVEIRNHGSLIQCDSCKRILYLEDASEAMV